MDPIADFLIAIKNAGLAGKPSVSVPYSEIKFQIASLLATKGFVGAVSKKGKKAKSLEVEIAYEAGAPRVSDVKRISKPSRRLYEGAKEIKPWKQDVGMRVFSTPKGILADMDARKEKVGGEILFSIW